LPWRMTRHELSDAAWERLAPLLPPQHPRVGRPAKDHRTILNAMLWLAKTGAPWRDLPERYGPWRSVATRFYRWTRSGLWQRILAELQRQGDAERRLDWSVHMVDGTNIRAHRHAAGAKGGSRTRRSAVRVAASAASSTSAASVVDDPSRSSSRPANATNRPRSTR
jgi:transposase